MSVDGCYPEQTGKRCITSKFWKPYLKKRWNTSSWGGLAVNLYGVPRVTQDLDLIISPTKTNIAKLLAILKRKRMGYRPRLPVDPKELMDPERVKDWVENRNLKAFGFYHKKENYKAVDVLLVHPLNFEKSFMNKTVKKVHHIEIYLASLNDLIKTKKVGGRMQDKSDINMLKKVKSFQGEKA